MFCGSHGDALFQWTNTLLTVVWVKTGTFFDDGRGGNLDIIDLDFFFHGSLGDEYRHSCPDALGRRLGHLDLDDFFDDGLGGNLNTIDLDIFFTVVWVQNWTHW